MYCNRLISVVQREDIQFATQLIVDFSDCILIGSIFEFIY